MAYSTKVLDHYNNPRNVGSLDKSSSKVGTGMVGAFLNSGDTVSATVTFNTWVAASGSPSLSLDIGGNSLNAALQTTSG